MFQFRTVLLASLFTLTAVSQSVSAQYYSPYTNYYGYGSNTYYPQSDYSYQAQNYGYDQYGSPTYDSYNYGSSGYGSSYGSGYYHDPSYNNPDYASDYSSTQYYGYGTDYYNSPSYGSNYYSSPDYGSYNYSQPKYGTTYYNFSSYRQPYYERPYVPRYKKKKGGRDFAEDLWPGERDNIYTDFFPVHGPWDRGWGKAPWNREYEDLWDDSGGGPDKWFDWDDPKEGLAWMWEDFLYTPNALGRMPGGWDAPTFAVPNPIDVGDELKDASADFPGEVKDFSEGFTFGDRTIIGTTPKKDSGSFGLGDDDDDEEEGINIAPKVRR